MISKLLVRENLLGEFQSVLVLFALVTALQKKVPCIRGRDTMTCYVLLSSWKFRSPSEAESASLQPWLRVSHVGFQITCGEAQLYAPLFTPPTHLSVLVARWQTSQLKSSKRCVVNPSHTIKKQSPHCQEMNVQWLFFVQPTFDWDSVNWTKLSPEERHRLGESSCRHLSNSPYCTPEL